MRQKLQLLFSQDECAPDSLEKFETDFLEQFGICFKVWKAGSKKLVTAEDELGYTQGDILATVSAYNPFWEVYKIVEQTWFSPVQSEREAQEAALKELWPNFPNDCELFQYLNGLLYYAKAGVSMMKQEGLSEFNLNKHEI